MAFSLFPKDVKFHELFAEQNRMMIEAAEILQDIFQNFSDVPSKCNAIGEVEKKGNHLCREIGRKLSLTFITPLDREDIHELNQAQEAVINAIRSVAIRIALYELMELKKASLDLVSTLHAMADGTGKMLGCLKLKKDPDEYTKTIETLKLEADTILLVALGELYEGQNGKADVTMGTIKWTHIYDRLETSINLMDDLTHVIEGMILKYV